MSKKRLVWAIGAITLGVLVLTAIFTRNAIRTEWWRRQAVKECLEPNLEKPTSVWNDILGSGEAGFPCLAKLLRDPDFRIGEHAAERIGKFDGRESVIEFLRENDHLALFSYYCLSEHVKQYGLSHDMLQGERASDAHWFTKWSGDEQDLLEPSAQAIDLLEALLNYSPPDPEKRAYPNDEEAVDGLSAMLRPGEVRSPRSPLAARIVDILARARNFQALNRMVLRSEPLDSWSLIESEEEGAPRQRITECEWFYMPDLDEWVDFPTQPITCHVVYDARCFKERNALLALCHADGKRAIRVIARLLRNPEVGPTLEQLLAERPRLGPLEMPRWLPIVESAYRLKDVTFLAEEGLREGVPFIKKLLAASDSSEGRAYFRACLLALGEESERKNVRLDLERHIAANPEDGLISASEFSGMLLFSGDFPTLARIFESGRWYLMYEPSVQSHLEGLPEPLLDQDAAGARRDWWRSNKDHVAFDPAKRRFVLR